MLLIHTNSCASRCLDQLCRCPAVTPKPNQSMLTNVQSLIIKTVSHISPFHDNDDAWALVTEFALGHLHKAILRVPADPQVPTMIVTHKPYGQPWHTFVTAAWQGDKTARNIFLASCSVAENALRALYDMLEACDEPTTQARIFGILVEGLQDLSVALPRSLQVLNEFDIFTILLTILQTEMLWF